MTKKNTMEITVYGANGYVGRAVTNFLENHFDLVMVDPSYDDGAKEVTPEVQGPNFETGKTKTLLPYVENIKEWTRCAVVCVPTPMGDDGSCDTSIVEEILNTTDNEFYLIKSTIPPGTTEKLMEKTGKKIAFSPEYIGEGKYVTRWWDKNHPHPQDMKKHTFQIFGGEREVTREWVNIFGKVLGPSCSYIQTTSRTAEFVKYMENCWGGMKVTWANEMFEMTEALGLDYNEVRELWALDGRTEKMHTMIWPDKRGFGGKCFPKDINAMVKFAEKAGYDAKLIKQVLESNKEFVAKNEK